FLAGAHPSVMATVAKDGRPVAVATWFLSEGGGRILVNLDAERVRLAHLRREPRFALDVLNPDDWYSHLSLQLVADDYRDDTDLVDIDALSRHYLGKPYPNRHRPRVSVRAQISRWSRWEPSRTESGR
ncbi:MAG: pyridoxamine 5'-phosphate oxidase family protein, partial [Actinomycetota bacterium]|nr:pyridoxamine 5'-phosphate oxidase family protein [Actinomycetota bacterium]